MNQQPHKDGFWKILTSVLFTILLSMIGYIVNQNDGKIKSLEDWRVKHEELERAEMAVLHSRLAAIETKLDLLLNDKLPGLKK